MSDDIILSNALRDGLITIQGKKNPDRYLYKDNEYHVVDYSKDSYGEDVLVTTDIEEALEELNNRS